MATIPDANLRHVRKTVALDGSANNGNLGDYVPVFTTTGAVIITRRTVYCTENLVCSAAANTTLFMVTPDAEWALLSGDGSGIPVDGAVAGKFASDVLVGWFDTTETQPIHHAGAAVEFKPFEIAVSDDITLYVNDAGSGADITDGTLVFDLWYLPITDDGALAGDDIDTGRIPVNATAISGDTTAADRLEALMDGIVPGIVGASSTVTSVANCTGFTEATNDHFNGRLITFLTGNLAGQQCQITDYTGSTQSFTVTPLTEAPASSDTFVIH